MFNDTATHSERQRVLQSLLAAGAADVGSGVHGPPEVNRLLARGDAEFRLFQQVGCGLRACMHAQLAGSLAACAPCQTPLPPGR